MTKTLRLIGLMALVTVFCGGIVSFAAPGAGAKAGGQFNFYAGSSRNALSSARSQVGTFRQYAEGVASGAPGMHASPVVAKEANDTILQAVARSESYLSTARKRAAGDATITAALDEISSELAEVKKCCAELAECCDTDMPDAKRSAECCRELEAALAKAIAAHDRVVPPPAVDQHQAPKASGHHTP